MAGFVLEDTPVELAEGDGVHLTAADGTRYLDAGASYGAVPLGHGHPAVEAATVDQLRSLGFAHASYPTAAREALETRLADLAPGDCGRVWLCNSGSEAVEAALKFARSATGRSGIVAARGGFHGRTMGALSATWKPKYRVPYRPLVPHVEFVPFGDAEALTAAVDDGTAAVILEPVQGEGGVVPAPEGYLQAARAVTADAGAALVLDEVQTGLGRTGAAWACERAGVVPDALTTAKGLANGLPAGATLCRDWIADGAGPHGSTYGGGPVVAAAALATVETIVDEGLPAHAGRMGERLRDGLAAADIDGATVRGEGLMVGVELPDPVDPVLGHLAEDHRVLAMPAGRSVVRLLPPLVLEEAHVDRLVTAVSEAVASVASGPEVAGR